MRAYPAYKPSGVEWLGDVPEGWEVAPVKRRFNVALGKMLQPERRNPEDTEQPYLRAANIQWRTPDLSDVKTMWFSPSEMASLALRKDDLLVSEGGDVGRSAIWQEEMESCFIQNSVNRVRAQGQDSTTFLYYWMVAIKDRGYVDVLCNKSTIAHFTAEKLEAVPMPLPPLPEQQAIAGFLDREVGKIDALVAEQRQLMALLAEKRQAVISHAVTQGLNPHAPRKPSGIDWLGDVPEGWEVVPLKRLSPAISVGVVVNPSEYVSDEGLPFIYGGDISEGKIAYEKARRIAPEASASLPKSQLREGDILTVRVGAPGVTAVVGSEGVGGNCASVMLIRKGTHPSNWLCYAMNSRHVRYQVEVVQYGAAQEQFNISHAVDFKIVTPPIEEAKEIVAYLDAKTAQLDTLTETASTAIALLQERRAALISAAVTGKIDLRDLTP